MSRSILGEITTRAIFPGHTTYDADTGCPTAVLPTAAAWPANNLAIYVPFAITTPTWVRRLWYACGGAGSPFVDLGIYNAAGTRLISTGATARGTTNIVVMIEITDLWLPPGDYWFAASWDTTTAQPWRSAATGWSRFLGVCQESAAHPLPATMTPVVAGQDYIPFMGYSTIAAEM